MISRFYYSFYEVKQPPTNFVGGKVISIEKRMKTRPSNDVCSYQSLQQ